MDPATPGPAPPAAHSVPPTEPSDPGAAARRIGQACLACRRKKIKCDGQLTCHNCSSRELPCEYPGSNDNASSSRRYAQTLEERCKELDDQCRRLEVLSRELTRSIASVQRLNATNTSPAGVAGQDNGVPRVDGTLQGQPGPHQSPNVSVPSEDDGFAPPSHDDDEVDNIHEGPGSDVGDDDSDGDETSDGNTGSSEDESGWSDSASKFGSLVADSYGRLRYLGGPASNVLVEVVNGLSPAGESSVHHLTPGSVHLEGAPAAGQLPLEMPMFIRGMTWPDMPYLPRAEDITKPPRYVADLLVNLFFDQLHYTFPVVYRPQFMSRYEQLMASHGSSPADKGFLSVFFAVCACASNLLPSDGSATTFPGLSYYQDALILHHSSFGEASLERVQCLALLAMCSGGWNTLTQSWTFAGQAVRAAQDLGMHMSSLSSSSSSSNEPTHFVRKQLLRRIWWAVYCLDRVTSTCLGRPMAADDSDCYCELPRNICDQDLESYRHQKDALPEPLTDASSSPMTGFLAFIRLCRIGGKIQKLHSPSRIRRLRNTKTVKQFIRSVSGLQRALDKWLASLPDEVRFSANTEDRGPHLTMCVIMFIAHAGLLLNLYQLFSGTASQSTLGSHWHEAVSHCISAARSCIHAAELIQRLVPPSHHLALCIHYLTLSGLVLLRIPECPIDEVLPDVEKCVKFLKGLETTWSGAKKGRVIIERLVSWRTSQVAQGATPQISDHLSFPWEQMIASELFSLDGVL